MKQSLGCMLNSFCKSQDVQCKINPHFGHRCWVRFRRNILWNYIIIYLFIYFAFSRFFQMLLCMQDVRAHKWCLHQPCMCVCVGWVCASVWHVSECGRGLVRLRACCSTSMITTAVHCHMGWWGCRWAGRGGWRRRWWGCRLLYHAICTHSYTQTH